MKTYKIRNKADGGILEVTEDQLAAFGLEVPNKMAKGGMIKRADGSYSKRGLWDNIRKNKGSGKKPTKAMLEQEAKIRAAEKAYGGYMDMGGYMNPYMNYGGYMATGGCMSCGGKMQKGGTVSIKQIEEDAKWKPSDKKYIPLPPAPIVDYPPSYIIDETLPPIPPQPFNYPIGRYNLPGTYVQTPEFAEGGKMPQWLAEARFPDKSKLEEYGYKPVDQAGDGKWIQKATASIKRRGTEGKCTPITKPGCTGRAKALAKTFRKMAKARKKEDGGMLQVGQTLNLTKREMDDLIAQGYQFEME